ncbi:hypothetical protein PG990_004516, partial [Apiospora arundinis]
TATSAAAPVMTETGQQQPGRGRSGRGRGGRRRGAAQGQERRQQNPQAANLTDTQSPSVSQPSDAVAQDAGAPSSSNRGGGRGRRGARNPRRGGGGEPRRGGGVGEPRQRAAHGGRRTFGGHLTSDAASNNNSGSPVALSVEAPEFVPGQQPPATRNGAPGGAVAQAGRSAAPKKEMLPKSTATDLPTRIHEDINNGHYECVICTNETVGTKAHLIVKQFADGLSIAAIMIASKHVMLKTKNPPIVRFRRMLCRTAPVERPNWQIFLINPGRTAKTLYLPVERSATNLWNADTDASRDVTVLPARHVRRPWTSHADAAERLLAQCVTRAIYMFLSEKKAVERVAARRKRKNGGASNDEVEAEHICVRVCGRNLKCGKHACAQMCHPGPCPTCPEAVFEEISCNCGRTVLYPPQPCGTQPPECRYECTRSSPACGHPRVSHTCHTDDKPCPPCPFLVEKRCICGKQTLKNQPCWFEEPRCGLPCGNKLKCGTHLCTKPCHRPGECEDANIRGSHCQQPCLKVKKACDHADTDPCHAPYPCKEEKPCQAKTFITCECQHRKQEVRCMASKGNPFPDRPPLKCDDECLRLQRNAKLAAALNIDPETHKDSHVPYSDKTLELFKEGVRWAQTQEREFRVFASDAQEKRLRFKPMKSQQRAFLHALAEDYGFDSESQDPEPHRHVSIFKTPRFVSAPAKTLAQCVQIKTSNATEDAASAGPVTNPLMNVPYNALLLTVPRFGLTVEEVEAAIAKDLATQPTVTFTTGFLPNDEIVIKGSGTWAAQALETAVTALKPLVSQTITRTDIAKAVFLCHADTSLNVLRREVDPVKNADGWNSVVGRSSARQARSAAASSSEAKPAAGRKLLMLKKEPKKKVEVEPVEDDWEAAAEKIADETED